MKNRNCPVCKKEIDCESPICKYCKKGVFVVDFGDAAASIFEGKLHAYEICGFEDISFPPGTTPPKPPREWRCRKYEPVVFVDK